MSAPSPVTSMQTPQHEFAAAKVVIKFGIRKFICKKSDIITKKEQDAR